MWVNVSLGLPVFKGLAILNQDLDCRIIPVTPAVDSDLRWNDKSFLLQMFT
jgi:hypothetical protein